MNVTVNGDLLDEADETYFVNLSSPVNATIADGQGLGTITDDDVPVDLDRRRDRHRGQLGNGERELRRHPERAEPPARQCSVRERRTGRATAPGDYLAASGTLDFDPGETTQSVSVTVNGDMLDEVDETYFVNLSSPVNATIADGQGLGTITDDDAPPAISIDDVTVTEGNSGTTNATFTSR